MAAFIDGVFPATLQDKIKQSKVLVVGAGGIGCEVLKNLVLSGFQDIEIIDLDTIDLSNLNRQFLFHREHVGKSKAKVARESALAFNPDAKIVAYHDSIMSFDYGVTFFKKFDVVLNALDNRQARSHVNRMCLYADVPLIESGTSGYNGQVELIKKGMTQCYECVPKPKPRTFPGCTIRNTPSEPIHCIVWAKHLFNQLFGETSDEEDISPDIADPEAKGTNGEVKADGNGDVKADGNGESKADGNGESKADGNGESKPDGNGEVKVDGNGEVKADGNGDGNTESMNKGIIQRINTRQWAKENNYNPEKLFNKFFFDDINYLITMSNLWSERKSPVPVELKTLLQKNGDGDAPTKGKRDYHVVWSVEESAEIFAECINELSTMFLKLENGESLIWDKDDKSAMDFVAACANIRSHIFHIEQKSRFEMKSMAGNIIPAIATTNAIAAGLAVIRAFNILCEKFEKCKTVYTRLRLNPRKRIIIPDKVIELPNKNCHVCSSDPAVTVRIDLKQMRVKDLRDDLLIKTINMIQPDVLYSGRGGIVVLSSDADETGCNEDTSLFDLGIGDGAILQCDDFFQNYSLNIVVEHFDAEYDKPIFEVIAEENQLKPKEEEEKSKETDIADDGPSSSKRPRLVVDDDDDLEIIEDEVIESKNKMDVTPINDDSTNKDVPTPMKSAVKRKQADPATKDVLILDSDDDEENFQSLKAKRSRQ